MLRHPRVMPTGEWAVFAAAVSVQRWVSRRGFYRWGVQMGEVRRHAWRPFEVGQRGGVGWELALRELRMVLALTGREDEVESWYGEGERRVWGDRAYQVIGRGQITGYSRRGMSVRVRRRGV